MKTHSSSAMPERIEVAEKRIIELETLINHWKMEPVDSSFWETECSNHPSSPSCLLFDT